MQDIRVEISGEEERLKKMLQDLSKMRLGIGIRAGEHFEEDGTDVALVALGNEYGTDNAPARPFMTQTVENHAKEINQSVKNAFKKDKAEEVLKRIGERVAQLMCQEIMDGDFAPNAPSTIARKGSDKPLIDTQTMINSVEFWIDKG